MSTLKITTLSKQDGSASVPVDTVVNGSAKAWVNFNGTGTVAIRAAFNVSSITDNGTGAYSINFSAALPDANYAPVALGNQAAGTVGSQAACYQYGAPTVSSTSIATTNGAGTLTDNLIVNVAVFR